MRWLSLLLLTGCDPYAGWPDPHQVFPWRVVDDQSLEPYESVRWEEGPWDPEADADSNGKYLQKALLHRTGTPTQALFHWGEIRPRIPPLQRDQLTLSFAGDILPISDPPANYDAVSGLLDGDLRIGNLETPVAPSVDADPGSVGVPRFNAPEALLDALSFDVLQVVNNHSLDAGDAGLEETLALLEARGVAAVGVDGMVAAYDLGEGEILAFSAYTWGVNDPAAVSAHDLGVVPFGVPGRVDLSRIEADLAFLKDAGVTLNVVMVHWGYEYEYYPDPHFLKIARGIIEAGADLVVGTGPHTVQPAEWCTVNIPAARPGVGTCSLRTPDGEPRYAGVFYSLGNFGTNQPTLPLQVGMIGHANLAPGVGVVGMGWDAIASVTEGGSTEVVPLVSLLGDEAIDAEAARVDQHLGTGWKRPE